MTNRFYRGVLGLMLLISLYFNQSWMMYALITMLFLEGITDILVPTIVNTIGKTLGFSASPAESMKVCLSLSYFSNERIWRLVVASLLLVTYSNVDVLWFFPWFMGFAIFGAGLSGVCPVMLFIQWIHPK